MAANPTSNKQPKERMSAKEMTDREVKEVATKLRNLPPTAKAEVVNMLVGRTVSRQFSGFGEFLREQGVVGIGIGLVFGVQIKAVVDTVMASFVNPITELILPGGSLSKQTVSLSLGAKHVQLGWGAIVYSLLTFAIVAFIIYMAYKMLKLERFKKK
jgi:large-conductance mechanosensitive channel